MVKPNMYSQNRLTIYFSIFGFILFGCQQNSENLPKENGEIVSGIEIPITTRTYISDSVLMVDNTPTELKNGYRVENRYYTTSEFEDTLQSIVLMKDTLVIKELNWDYSYKFLQKNIGYVGADFEASFVFVQSFGSGNPHYIQLFEKENGSEILNGIWVDKHEKEQILLYLDSQLKQLKIYDVKNQKDQLASGFEHSKCADPQIRRLRDCVKIDTVTSDQIILKIETNEERIIHRFER